MIEIILSITEALYPEYSIMFMFDNATNNFVSTKDALCVYKMNKIPNGKQVILCNGWYIEQMGMYHIQLMWYLGSNKEQISKKT